jgi:RHS repeat-associated protein
VRVIEKEEGTPVSDQHMVWVGMSMAEICDTGSGAVVKRYFAQGEQRVGGADAGKYYYTCDHLGSVRELTDNAGAIRAQYDYAPFGERTKRQGDLDTDVGFTGFHLHLPTGLDQSPTRLYSSADGRWTSRDAMAEGGGLNLYAYAEGDPINKTDPLGLISSLNSPAGAEAAGFFEAVYGQGIVNGVIGVGLELVREGAASAGGRCNAFNLNRVLKSFVEAAVVGAILGGAFRVLAPVLGRFVSKLVSRISPVIIATETTTAIQQMADAAFGTGSIRTVAGYEVAGNAGLVGQTYNVNVWGLYATKNSQGLVSLSNALRAEAGAVGASQISITWNAVVNEGLLNISTRLAGRLGFTINQVKPTTILLQGAVP